MDMIEAIVFAITTGMAGSALYDGLKPLFGKFWDRFILLKEDKPKLIEEVKRILERKKDDATFMTNLQKAIQQHSSVINITTGYHSNIVNNPKIHGDLHINNSNNHIQKQVNYYRVENGKMEEKTIDNESTTQGEAIYFPLLFPNIWNKVF